MQRNEISERRGSPRLIVRGCEGEGEGAGTSDWSCGPKIVGSHRFVGSRIYNYAVCV